MKICMTLLTDTIFGNGESIPGAEDIAVLTDEEGFPYYKGTTFKGVFREELIRYFEFTGCDEIEIREKVSELLGNSGDNDEADGKLTFSDLVISDGVKKPIIKELGNKSMYVTDVFTNVRIFTQINDKGVVERGSLRTARCVNKGVSFYGEIECLDNQKEMICDVLGLIKGIGTMRNRGFGSVSITEEEQ
ncbi:MAG: hypothetical protein K5644_08810 [Lachnospiraceae bacterium]|nr:hypothetical protein [Lachnospiraceae bacterium]